MRKTTTTTFEYGAQGEILKETVIETDGVADPDALARAIAAMPPVRFTIDGQPVAAVLAPRSNIRATCAACDSVIFYFPTGATSYSFSLDVVSRHEKVCTGRKDTT